MDKECCDATYRYTVNPRKLTGNEFSERFYVDNLACRINMMSYRSGEYGHDKFLGIFLKCDSDCHCSPSWSSQLTATFRLLNHNPGYRACVKKFTHVFSGDGDSMGYGEFKSWGDVLNPACGYIKDGKITVEVHVTAEEPGTPWWFTHDVQRELMKREHGWLSPYGFYDSY